MAEERLGNFVRIEEEQTIRMRFRDHRIYAKQIKDKATGELRVRNVLQFDVEEFDGAPSTAVYEVTSEKHFQDFREMLPGKTYRGRLFTITAHGRGYLREYTVTIS